MKCNVCDRQLGEKEISWNKDINNFEMCGECLEVALDAAFSDGFLKEDDEFILINDPVLVDYDENEVNLYRSSTTKEEIDETF